MAVPGCPGQRWSSHQESRNNPLGCRHKAWNTQESPSGGFQETHLADCWDGVQRERGCGRSHAHTGSPAAAGTGTGEASLCRSLARQCMARTGTAQGHCSGQRSGGQLTRRPGSRGSQCVYMSGLKRSSDLGWAQASPSTTAARAGERTQQPHAGESCGLQTRRKNSRLYRKPGSRLWEPGRKISFFCNILFRALNLEKAEEKYLKALIHFHRSGNKG